MSPVQRIFVNRFFHPDHSATSQMLSDLAFELAKAGERVCVITSRGLYDDSYRTLPALETVRGVVVRRIYRPKFGRGSLFGRAIDYCAMYISFAVAVWKCSTRGDLLIVKTDPPLLCVALAPIAALKGLKLINWLQDLYPEVTLCHEARILETMTRPLKGLRNASLKFSVRNIAIGQIMGQRVKMTGVPGRSITVIPNWCDDAALSPMPTETCELRALWGLHGKFVVGYSGNLGRVHEYKTLLAAALKLKDEPDLVFLFIGGGHLTPLLKREVEALDLTGKFQFQPYQPQELLQSSLAAADVHWISLLPAMEGLVVPSKIYGVAAAGRPIIAVSDPNGEIGQLVTQNDCGVAVAPGDADGLAHAILAMKKEPARLRRWGENARELIERSFRKSQAIERWMEALHDAEMEPAPVYGGLLRRAPRLPKATSK